MISSACGFQVEEGLVLIPYSFSIKIFSNLRPRISPPWSYVISTGHRYQTSHIVSTKFAIVIAFLLLYCITSKHPAPPFYPVQDKGDTCGTISLHIFGVSVELIFYLRKLQVLQCSGLWKKNFLYILYLSFSVRKISSR